MLCCVAPLALWNVLQPLPGSCGENFTCRGGAKNCCFNSGTNRGAGQASKKTPYKIHWKRAKAPVKKEDRARLVKKHGASSGDSARRCGDVAVIFFCLRDWAALPCFSHGAEQLPKKTPPEAEVEIHEGFG